MIENTEGAANSNDDVGVAHRDADMCSCLCFKVPFGETALWYGCNDTTGMGPCSSHAASDGGHDIFVTILQSLPAADKGDMIELPSPC